MEPICHRFDTPAELSKYLYCSGLPFPDYKRLMFRCAKIRGWKLTGDDILPEAWFPYDPTDPENDFCNEE